MHTFQPLPIDVVEFNPFTRLGKDWAILSAGSKAKSNIMTISWGGVGVLWGKNVVFIVVRDSRYTKEFLDQGDFFSVTFFDENHREALNYCGSHSGRDVNKAEHAGLTMAFRHSIPYVDEGNFVFLCKKMAATRLTEDNFLVPELSSKWYADGDMHTLYIAEIIDLMAR